MDSTLAADLPMPTSQRPDPSRGTSGTWVDRYLRLLGVAREPPSAGALALLARQHLLSIPFENASALLHFAAAAGARVELPDPSARLEQWERRAAGGVCFDVAAMLERLLVALGYEAWRVVGNMAPRGGVVQAPGTHQAVCARVDGRRYLVDVGNGAPFFDPLPVDGTTEVRFGALAYRFRPDAPDVFLQERWLEGQWVAFCAYDLAPATADALAARLLYHFTPGNSWVLGKLFLVRCTDQAVYAVAREARLTTYSRAGGKLSVPLGSTEHYERVANEILGLPDLPMREALAVQAELAR